jgi:ActR/RegA family two-component response regulator
MRAQPLSGQSRQFRTHRGLGPDHVTSRDRLNLLIIDGDFKTRECLYYSLKPIGWNIVAVSSGASGIDVAKFNPFDLVVIELTLPDMTGIDVVRRIENEVGHVRFILIGSCLSSSAIVEAMKLDALYVIEKPIVADVLISAACCAAETKPAAALCRARRRSPTHIRSTPVAERWTRYVLKACESDADLKTLSDWARCVGVSYSTLRETCSLLGMRPHDARDLTRLLRAIVQASMYQCRPEVLLDVSDRRTLANLMQRAGTTAVSPKTPVSLEQFFESQVFVEGDSEAIRLLRLLVQTRLVDNQTTDGVRAPAAISA